MTVKKSITAVCIQPQDINSLMAQLALPAQGYIIQKDKRIDDFLDFVNETNDFLADLTSKIKTLSKMISKLSYHQQNEIRDALPPLVEHVEIIWQSISAKNFHKHLNPKVVKKFQAELDSFKERSNDLNFLKRPVCQTEKFQTLIKALSSLSTGLRTA